MRLKPILHFLLMSLAAPLRGQQITGVVLSEGQPVSRVIVGVFDSSAVQISSTTTGVDGTFKAVVGSRGWYELRTRRIGYEPLSGVRVQLSGPVSDVRLTIRALPPVLDTVRTTEKAQALTPGRVFIQRHMADRKGFFASGAEIEMSGMSLSEFVEKLPGMQKYPRPLPRHNRPILFIGRNERYIAPSSTKCGYVRIDHELIGYSWYSRKQVTNIDDGLPLSKVMAVEIYPRFEDVPKEWWRFAWTNTRLPKCGLIQIWTTLAW